ncbi:MAG: ribonuclease HIII [Candidatus Aminicenantes bacterium]|nr:ribonuclease HIII [Candidatus Aminicenantes bacterium]MBL7082498.1 ribonuclease HIII [Candidatus Aminicenantes bacterium]
MKQPDLFPTQKGHIGTDESGKGDYFGPLVVAGVFLPDKQLNVLTELGVKDSKRHSDNRVRELADILKKGYKHSLVVIGPEKYNELYLKLRNLNKILAWAHSRAIENILEEVPCSLVITDQFGNKSFVLNALMKRGKDVELVQRPKAEEDLAVAAASILARAEFLKRLYFLSQDVGINLPKGASALVEETGLKLVKLQGIQILDKVVKKHFKITKRILASL